MSLKQKFSLVLAIVLASVLTVACKHPDAFLRPTPTSPPPAVSMLSSQPDAGAVDEPPLPDDDTTLDINVPPALKKPSWKNHFVLEVSYKGPINTKGVKIIATVVQLVNASLHDPQADPVEAMVLVLDTSGGDLTDGTTIVQLLEGVDVPLVCVADSRAFSMGFFIIQGACPVRLVTSRGSLMVHEPHEESTTTLSEPNRWDYWNQSEQLRVAALGWLGVCAQRMGMEVPALETHVRNLDWYMTAQEALEAHAVDAVIANVQVDVVKPLEQSLELPPRLGVPAGLLRAPGALPLGPAAVRLRHPR